MSETRAAVAPSPLAPAAPRLQGLTLVRRYGLLTLLVLLVGVSEYLYPRFLDWQNVRNILSQNALVGIVAVGMTFVMITGGFDLSVGSIYAAGATVYASLAVAGWPVAAAAAMTLLVGVVAGLVNGLIVTRLRVNPFVATLGTMTAYSGLALIYSNSSPFVVEDPGFTRLGRGTALGLQISIWLLFAFFAAGQFVLSKTVYGRSVFAIGGNNEASRLAGLQTEWLRTSTYVLSGACAAIAGMIIASRLAIGQADIGGTMSLDAIAVVVIGGTSLLGGEGAVWRTAIGVLIVAVLTNLLDSLAVDANYQLVIKGVIVIAAVALDARVRAGR